MRRFPTLLAGLLAVVSLPPAGGVAQEEKAGSNDNQLFTQTIRPLLKSLPPEGEADGQN